MDRQAKVTSVDALTTFRSSLVIYMGSVGNALDEVRDEVRRMRTWLQVDQRAHWGGQLKRLRKQLEQAEAELFTSRLRSMPSHSAARQMAVTRLRRMVRETEERAKALQKWIRNIPMKCISASLKVISHFFIFLYPLYNFLTVQDDFFG